VRSARVPGRLAGDRRYGLTPIGTFWQAIVPDPGAARRDAAARHPAGRLGTPADVAAAVAGLASRDAASVTGQCFTVDGGLTAASPLRPAHF